MQSPCLCMQTAIWPSSLFSVCAITTSGYAQPVPDQDLNCAGFHPTPIETDRLLSILFIWKWDKTLSLGELLQSQLRCHEFCNSFGSSCRRTPCGQQWTCHEAPAPIIKVLSSHLLCGNFYRILHHVTILGCPAFWGLWGALLPLYSPGILMNLINDNLLIFTILDLSL